MKLGDIVTLGVGAKAGMPHVVVREVVDGRVKLCYFGAGRWYVPEWHSIEHVTTDVEDSDRLRRCRRVLLAVTPDLDGWKRMGVGRHGQIQEVVVGHVDVPWRWSVDGGQQ